MAGKAISETYKGILRVANNINLVEGVDDKFLSSAYYLSPNDNNLYSNGLNETISFLQKSEEGKRFSSSDKYTTLKLPVTDSMGNYLNFALGVDSSLVGSYENIGQLKDAKSQFNENDTETFSVVNVPCAVKIGLSAIAKEEEKTATNTGLLSLDKDAKIAIENVYQIEDTNIVPSTGIRTVISMSDSPKYMDAFIYEQEQYVKDGDRRDCFVTNQNIKKYISERINTFVNGNAAGLPTGTIVSQYCSLDKWFCLGKGNEIANENEWEGYRPAMYAVGDAKYAAENVIQNQGFKNNTYLYSDGVSTGEAVPDFKRGYALCNGEQLTLKLCPSYVQNSESMQDSIRLFFDLFYFIGYYYSKGNKQPHIKRVVKDSSGNYRFTADLNDYTFEGIDNEVVYASTMASILIFKELEKIFKNSTKTFETPDKAIDKLPYRIPDEFVFNCISPVTDENNNSINSDFEYTSYLEDTYKINIGMSVTHFTGGSSNSKCKIPYYVYDENMGLYTIELVPLNKTAEAYHFAELFIKKAGIDEWAPFSYSFTLPELFTTTDSTANLALSKDINNPKHFAIGKFIGSNGIAIADEMELVIGNARTIDLKHSPLTYESHYVASEGLIPHTHYVAKGRDKLEASSGSKFRSPGKYFNPKAYKEIINDGATEYIQIEPDLDKTYASGSERLKPIYENRIDLETLTDGSQAVAADYKSSPFQHTSRSNLTDDLQLNYILQSVDEAVHHTISNTINGMSAANEYHIQDDNNDVFTWYGRTSEPIWSTSINSPITEKYNNTALGYFRPESVKVLPLIKL